MNKRTIIIIFCYLTNIITKDEKIIKQDLQDSRYLINTILGNSKLSGIEVNIDKYGLKFIAVNNKLSKNNKHVVLSLSRDNTLPSAAASIYVGGNITLGDSTNPIIIAPNNTITWPSELEIGILGINSNGQLITTTANSNATQLGEDGYNQIICSPTAPITITSKAPASGDIIFFIDNQTNGNIKFFGKNINLINGLALLAIDSNNNIITTENSLAYIGNTQGNYISVDNSLTINNKKPGINQPSQDINIVTGNNGNICISGNSINTPAQGNYSFLGINSSNQIITMNNSTTSTAPIYCNNLLASGDITLGTFTPGSVKLGILTQSSGANMIINNNTSDGITFNGNIYINNSGFPLPGSNQTTPLIIDNNGKIGILLSSAKYKTNIKPLHISAEAFNSLKPSSYQYKKNINLKSEINEFGFIAEEVYLIKELHDLVILDENGKPLSLKYHALPAIIIDQIQQDRKINISNNNKNEEHIKELSARLEKLEKIIKNLEQHN